MVIAYQPSAGAGGAPTCVMADITGVPGASGNCSGASGSPQANMLVHGTNQYQNAYQGCNNATPAHNKPGGVTDPATGAPVPPLSQAGGGQLFNLGGLPVVKVYAIRGGASPCATPSPRIAR